MDFFKSLTNYAIIGVKGRCYKIMTKFINWKHSNIGCNANTSRINSRLNQLQVAKVKEGKTHHAAGLSHFTRLKSGALVDFTRLKCRSARVRQARQVPDRAMPDQGLYTGVGAGKLELEMGAGAGAGKQ